MSKILRVPSSSEALPGRETRIPVPELHFVNGRKMGALIEAPHRAMFGMGCFWGVERKFWQLDGIELTAVGYASGSTSNPSYEEVCTGMTGHNEVVLVSFDDSKISYSDLLKLFWEGHNPTQVMQQGNDVGTQYRSGIYYFGNEQFQAAYESRSKFQEVLSEAGHSEIATEIIAAPEFFFAEEYHQQYLAKNPNGYCGVGGLGLSCG